MRLVLYLKWPAAALLVRVKSTSHEDVSLSPAKGQSNRIPSLLIQSAERLGMKEHIEPVGNGITFLSKSGMGSFYFIGYQPIASLVMRGLASTSSNMVI